MTDYAAKSGGRQPAVGIAEQVDRRCCWLSVSRSFPRLAYASRSWLHDVRSLRVA
jgi:hypothetical protein